ncbi:hypothetical protein K5G00_05525 [Maribellus maritimus]|nr:hypothetical protein [Maribellus maritimus]
MLDDSDSKEYSMNKLSTVFYSHPLIKYLGKNTWFERWIKRDKTNKPSYMTPANFSKVMIDLLRGSGYQAGESQSKPIGDTIRGEKVRYVLGKEEAEVQIETETLQYLRSIWADSQGDVEKFKVSLEQWFSDTMERASGWYKQKVQIILFFIGFFIAVFFNVDTISIAKKLSTDKTAREQMVSMANAYIENNRSLPIELNSRKDTIKAAENYNQKLDSLYAYKKKLDADIAKANSILGLGAWLPDSVETPFDSVKNVLVYPVYIDKKALPKIYRDKNAPSQKKLRAYNGKGVRFFLKAKISYLFCLLWYHFWGFLLTAFAISLGATFWFDLLNKLMKLRGSTQQKPENNKSSNPENLPPNIKRVG